MTSEVETVALPSEKSLSSEEILALEARFLCRGATETDLTFDHGRGSRVTDADGRDYIDLASGVLITNLGHAYPRVTRAVEEVVGRSPASYNHPTQLRATLCERLASKLPGDLSRTVFFSAGAEAIDAAIRMARMTTGHREVLSFRGAFHGRSYLALSVSGKRGLKAGVGEGVPGVVHLPYPDRDESEETIWRREVDHILATVSAGDVAAILAEPYQGSGGVIIPPTWFLEQLRELARSLGALLIVDEVQSGFGRTGSLFAIEQSSVVPDIVVFGKGMGNGVPMGALTTTEEVSSRLREGAFSSTFGGNIMACAAAHAVLDAFDHDDVLEKGRELSATLSSQLVQWPGSVTGVERIRIWGLAIGVQLAGEANGGATAKEVVRRSRAAGVVLIPPIGVFNNVLRIAPALTMNEDLALEGLSTVRQVIEEVVG